MGTISFNPHDFSEEEISAVRNKFSKLTLRSAGIWEGEVDINAEYNGHHIQDAFKIRIVASDQYSIELPVMIEIGGRTDAIAEKYKLKNKLDLHYNIKTGVACLCVKQEEKVKFPSGSDLLVFMDDLVVPYLYGLSYYDSYGKWPWGEYSHGGLGLLEFYAEDEKKQNKEDIEKTAKVFVADNNWKEYSKQLQKPSPLRKCICGSGRPFKKCHVLAWRGILQLNGHLKRLQLDIYKLYRR